MRPAAALLVAAALAGVAPAPATAQERPATPVLRSPLTGAPFHALPDTAGAIAAADAELAAAPHDLERVLAAGHARAAVWRYDEAIELYTRAAELAPDDWRPYRYRGHRYISTRRFPDAVRDLERAARLDGAAFDVAYHLGLARFLTGDFDGAAAAYAGCLAHADDPQAAAAEASRLPEGVRACAELAQDDDTRIALLEWYHRALRRAGRDADAARLLERVREGMAVDENQAYYATLLMYKGLRTRERIFDAAELSGYDFETIGFGVANDLLARGDEAGARAIWRRIIDQGRNWPAFGYIAAETELLRARER